MSEDKSGIDSFTAIIDDKDYTINRGDKITDILNSWFKIKYDINPNINLPFKSDDEKLKFYIILLREENSCFAKFHILVGIPLSVLLCFCAGLLPSWPANFLPSGRCYRAIHGFIGVVCKNGKNICNLCIGSERKQRNFVF